MNMSTEQEPLLGRVSCRDPGEARRGSNSNNKFKKWFRVVFNLELAMALHAFSHSINGVIVTNLYIEKACRVNLNYSTEICDHINDYDSENNQVQIIVSTLELYSTILSSIPVILMSMVIGSWSDRNGRKPVLIIPTIGSLISQLVYILNVFYSEVRVEFLLFSNLYSLFGGYTTLMLGMYSYMAMTTSSSTRTSRISVLHVCTSIGYTSGNFLSPFVYRSWGFYGTFGTTLVLLVLSMLFIIIFIEEPARDEPVNEEIRPNQTPVECIKEATYCVFKNRSGNRRTVMLLLLLIMLLLVASMSGGGGYLFTRKMFQWDELIYAEVGTLTTIISTTSNLVLLPLLSYSLEIPDTIIGVMATMSSFSDLVVTALAQTGSSYIFAKCLGLLSGQASITIRSLLSKIVPKSDLGKIYSMLGCFENIIPIVVSPVLTYTYNHTLDTFPGAVYAVSACITGIAVCCFAYVCFLVERNQEIMRDQENSQEEL